MSRPPWSQAFHAAPDDYGAFRLRGLRLLFDGFEILSAFYSGGDVGSGCRLSR
jgi:hypothetical protein